jgi:ankyrin repeat protein
MKTPNMKTYTANEPINTTTRTPSNKSKIRTMKRPKYNAILQAAKERKLDRFKLTAGQLVAIHGKRGRTGLHAAAEFGCLDQIDGGATADQLEAVLDRYRTSALYLAVAKGHIGQIQGGMTAEELANTKPIADIDFALLWGTAAELCQRDLDGPIEKTADVIVSSRNIPQITGLHCLAYNGGLNRVKGGVTCEHLAGLIDNDGVPALWLAAKHGRLDEILGGVTAEQLAAEKLSDGFTALHAAASFGHLDQIQGGATVEQLASVNGRDGNTPLHSAALYNSLDQITGGATAEQLAAIRNHRGQTGLHSAASYKHIKGGVTRSQLAGLKDGVGESALHTAAFFGCLDQIEGGVTAEDLAAVVNDAGNSALHMAARWCCLDQIKNGVTITQLSAVKGSTGHTPLDIALANGHLFDFTKDDRVLYWNGLKPEEREMLRKAMENVVVPEEIAAIAGSGTPGIEIQLENGFAQNSNVLWDRTSKGTLAVTRSFTKLDLIFPMFKLLVCNHCKKESRVTIHDRCCNRHHCPGCGAVYIFDADAYEQEAVKCIQSMRRIFPWSVQMECKCGVTFEHEFVSREADKFSCPKCGQSYQHAFAQEEQLYFYWMKDRLAKGRDPAGWSELPSRSAALACESAWAPANMNSIPCPIPDSQKKSQKNPSRLSPGRFHINVNKQNPITELEFMPKDQ